MDRRIRALVIWLVIGLVEVRCQDVEYDYMCYSSTKTTWDEARVQCMKWGGDLVSIHSTEENDQVAKLCSYSTEVWTGLNTIVSRTLRWSDGTAVDFENWNGQDPDIKPSLCVSLNSANGKWTLGECHKPSRILCKRVKGNKDPVVDPPPQPIPGYCPAGFTEAGNKCFKVASPTTADFKGATFEDARDACASEPGFLPSLASVQTSYENAVILSLMPEKADSFWIGLRRSTYNNYDYTKIWYWPDATPLQWKNWASSPSDWSIDECAVMEVSSSFLGQWRQKDCNGARLYGYICQTYKDADNIIPTPAPPPTNECKSGYSYYNGACYRYVTEPMSWSDALSVCDVVDLSLISIHYSNENHAVYTWMYEKNDTEIWSGLQDSNADGEYTWADGSYFQYSRWASREPNPKPGGGCVRIERQSKVAYWADHDCQQELPFICKQHIDPPPHVPETVEGVCPDQNYERWVPVYGHCYYYSESYTSWLSAREACLERGAVLTSIHSRAENDALVFNATNMFDASFWIGLHRSKDGKNFVWDDYSPLQYEHWSTSSPTYGDGRDCVFTSAGGYYGDGTWTNTDCVTGNFRYVCRKDKAPPATEPPIPEDLVCPDEDWIPRGSICYLFEPDVAVTWEEASEQCRSRGGSRATLASIHSLAENRFLEAVLYEASILPIVDRNFWIGLTKKDRTDESEMTWVDESKMEFTNWGPSQPNYIFNCSQLNTQTGKWSSQDCERFRGFVCQYTGGDDEGSEKEEEGHNTAAAIALATISGIIVGVLLIVGFVLYMFPEYRPKLPKIGGSGGSTSGSGTDTPNIQYSKYVDEDASNA